jgi:hypothetical protein
MVNLDLILVCIGTAQPLHYVKFKLNFIDFLKTGEQFREFGSDVYRFYLKLFEV